MKELLKRLYWRLSGRCTTCGTIKRSFFSTPGMGLHSCCDMSYCPKCEPEVAVQSERNHAAAFPRSHAQLVGSNNGKT